MPLINRDVCEFITEDTLVKYYTASSGTGERFLSSTVRESLL